MKDKFNDSDIGMYITYVPTGEIGRLKQFDNNSRVAWVVYKCGDNWDQYQNYTAQATDYIALSVEGSL
jgi:hypothetical protein